MNGRRLALGSGLERDFCWLPRNIYRRINLMEKNAEPNETKEASGEAHAMFFHCMDGDIS